MPLSRIALARTRVILCPVLRIVQALAIVLLVLTATGVVDLDVIFGHVDDCADQCCRLPGSSSPHCTCCCIAQHVTLAPSDGTPQGAGQSTIIPLDFGTALCTASPSFVFHPPRA